jgi:hypothetical protein
MLTYEKIIKESRDFATNHNQISSFDNGDLWEVVQHNKLQDYSYPLIFMNDGVSNVAQGVVTFAFNILAVDQVINGEVNENFVKSSMHQILLDYLAYFKHTYLYDIEGSKLTFKIESTAQMNSFTERFTDTLTGWNMSVTFRIPFDASKCNIPLHSVPLPPEPFICSVDATVENSQGTLITSKTVTSLDSVIDIPNITLTDSDGTTRSEPSGVNLVCTPVTPDPKDLTIAIPYEASEDTSTVTIIANAVGTITAADTTGLTSVVYEVNSSIVTIPFALALSDILEITYDAALSSGTIILTGTYV